MDHLSPITSEQKIAMLWVLTVKAVHLVGLEKGPSLWRLPPFGPSFPQVKIGPHFVAFPQGLEDMVLLAGQGSCL